MNLTIQRADLAREKTCADAEDAAWRWRVLEALVALKTGRAEEATAILQAMLEIGIEATFPDYHFTVTTPEPDEARRAA